MASLEEVLRILDFQFLKQVQTFLGCEIVVF
jgi:hypothetical protein